jgi:hypothetical protein
MTKIKCEMLPLPKTLPDDADAVQFLSVVHDRRGGIHVSLNDGRGRIHVSIHDDLDDLFEYPWVTGAWLADVAYIIAGQLEFALPRKDPERKMFALICKGFNKRAKAKQES